MSFTRGLSASLMCVLSLSVNGKMKELDLGTTEDGHFSLEVLVNGHPSTFMLDTGATGTVIDQTRLQALGIQAQNKTIDGMTGGDEKSAIIQSQHITLKSFKIDGMETGLKQAFTHNVHAQLGENISGLVGQDVLVKTNAMLDLSAPSLLLPTDPESKKQHLLKLRQQGYSQAPIQSHPMGFHYIGLKLADRNVRLILDSGAPQVILDKQTIKRLGLKSVAHPSARSIDKDGNSHPMEVLTEQDLVLNQHTLIHDFMVSDLSGLMNMLNKKQGIPFVGVIGIRELSSLHSILDLASSTLYIKG